jgi:polyhydroxyalkanoate synthesis regulator phasin
MVRSKSWMAPVLGLAMVGAALAAPGRQGRPQRPQAHHGGQSPIEAITRMLDQAEAAGKDVSALRSELDALRPEWEELDDLRKDLEGRMQAFAPKVQDLAQRIQAQLGGAGGAGGSPIEGLEQALGMLESKGEDVSRLRSELDGLRGDWDELKRLEAAVQNASDDTQRQAAHQELEAFAQKLRPRVQSLAKKVQAKMGADGPQGPGPRGG